MNGMRRLVAAFYLVFGLALAVGTTGLLSFVHRHPCAGACGPDGLFIIWLVAFVGGLGLALFGLVRLARIVIATLRPR